MTADRERGRHVVVALDASASSLRALEEAAGLAAALGLELKGVFVEDANVLRLSGFAFVREVGSYSARSRAFEPDAVERELRAQASRARRALETTASRLGVPWSFEVSRGAVPAQLVACSAGAELVTIGVTLRARRPSHRLGRVADRVLRQSKAPVLLLPKGRRVGRHVVALHDGGEAARRGVELAARLAAARDAPWSVLCCGTDREAAERRVDEARAWAASLPGRPEVRGLLAPDAATFAAALAAEPPALVVVPAGGACFSNDPDALTPLAEWPVLVVR